MIIGEWYFKTAAINAMQWRKDIDGGGVVSVYLADHNKYDVLKIPAGEYDKARERMERESCYGHKER